MDSSRPRMSSVMDAANALTSLGDEESGESKTNNSTNPKDEAVSQTKLLGGDLEKRYLPDHKKPDAAPTFPEKLMAMMRFAESHGDDFCVAWLEDGKSFIIRDADAFTKKVVPKFFKPTKFSSFTRKLYRWGFRQINRGIGQDEPIIFGNDCFQRGNPQLMANMKSTTAAATRKAEEMAQSGSASGLAGSKRPAEVAQIELQQQLLLSQLLTKKGNYGNEPASPASAMAYPNVPQTPNPAFNQPIPSLNMNQPTMSLSKMMHQGAAYSVGSPSQNSPGNGTSPQQLTKPYEAFMPQRLQSNNCAGAPDAPPSLLGQFAPHNMGVNMQTAATTPGLQEFPNAATTAEIVNAAIQALKYA